MIFRSVLAGIFFFATILPGTAVFTQPRSFSVPVNQTIIDGITLGIGPGDTLWLEAGNRPELHFKNLTGTLQQPVVITNRNGKVIVHSEKEYGIFLDNSVHCKVTGAGSASHEYGIEIASSNNHGLVIAEFSSECEADHLEIHHTAYAGVVAKTDPDCRRKDLRFFTMKNLAFHHNFIHDTYAEGFYIGYSWYPARAFPCGEDSLLYPHEIHGLRIYDNKLVNTGQEAIQAGCGTRDIKIYSNTVYNYGVNNTLWQNHGVQIGQGTTGELFNNLIDKGPAEGVSLFGGGNNFVYDNWIRNTGAAAIYQNDRGAVKGAVYKIYDNRITNPAGEGIVLVSDYTTNNQILNNVLVTIKPDSAIVDQGKNKWRNEGNKIYTKSELAGDAEMKRDVLIFPFENTAAEMKTVRTTGVIVLPVAGRKTGAKLFNSQGLPVAANKPVIKSKGIEIDLRKWPDGIYYIAGAGGESKKLLVRLIKQAKTTKPAGAFR